MIMVIKFEHKIVNQIGTSVSFLAPKKGNTETLKAIVCQKAPLAKLPPGGGGVLIYSGNMTFSVKMQFF